MCTHIGHGAARRSSVARTSTAGEPRVRLVRNAVDHLRRQVGHIRQSPRRAPTRAPAAGREAFAGSEVHRLPVGLLLAQMEGLDGNAGTNPRRWTAWSSSRYRAVSRCSHAAGVRRSGKRTNPRGASLACRRPRPYETDPTDTRGPEGGRYFIFRPPRTVDEMPSTPSAVRLGRSSPPPTSNASSPSLPRARARRHAVRRRGRGLAGCGPFHMEADKSEVDVRPLARAERVPSASLALKFH